MFQITKQKLLQLTISCHCLSLNDLIYITFALLISLFTFSCTSLRILSEIQDYNTYTEEEKKLINNGQIKEGFDKKKVFIALGHPTHRVFGIEKYKNYEKWIYTLCEKIKVLKSDHEYSVDYNDYQRKKSDSYNDYLRDIERIDELSEQNPENHDEYEMAKSRLKNKMMNDVVFKDSPSEYKDDCRLYVKNFVYFKNGIVVAEEIPTIKVWLGDEVKERAASSSQSFIYGYLEGGYRFRINNVVLSSKISEKNVKNDFGHYENTVILEREIVERKRAIKKMVNTAISKQSRFENEEAIKILEKALKLAVDTQDKEIIESLFEKIDLSFNSYLNFELKLKYLTKCVSEYKMYLNTERHINYLEEIGRLYLFENKRFKTINYYKQLLPIIRKYELNEKLINVLEKIGEIYRSEKDLNTALQYHNDALAVSKKIGKKASIHKNLIEIGTIYNSQQLSKQSLECFNESLNISKKLADVDRMAESLINIGLVYRALGQEELAVKYFENSVEISPYYEGHAMINKILHKNMSVSNKSVSELVVQTGLFGSAQSVAISPDGTIIAAGEYYSGRVKFWDLRSGKELRNIKMEGGEVIDMSFTSDGKSLATISTQNIGYLIDVTTGKVLKQIVKPLFGKSSIMNMSASIECSSQKVIAAGIPITNKKKDIEHVIKLWDQKGNEIAKLNTATVFKKDDIKALSFSADGNFLVVGREKNLELWDITDKFMKWSKEYADENDFEDIKDISFDLHGEFLIAVFKNSIAVIKVETGETIQAIELESSNDVYSAIFSKDSEKIYSVGKSNVIYIWDWKSKKIIREIETDYEKLSHLYQFKNKSQIAITASNTISIWNIEKEKLIKILKRDIRSPRPISLSKDSRTLITSYFNSLLLWDLSTGETKGTYNELKGIPNELIPAPNSNHLLIYSKFKNSNGKSNSKTENYISLINLSTLERLWEKKVKSGWLESPRFSPDGKFVAFLLNRERVYIINASNGEQLINFIVANKSFPFSKKAFNKNLPDVVFDIAYTKVTNANFLAYHGILTVGRIPNLNPAFNQYFNTTIDFWMNWEETSKPVFKLKARGPVVVLETSKNGKYFACSYPEGWLVHTVRLEPREVGPVLKVNGRSLAFNPNDDRILAVGTGDGHIEVWNLETNSKITEFQPASTTINELFFSGDGKTLISSSWECGVQIWDMEKFQLRSTFFFNGKSRLIVTPENFYTGSKDSYSAVAFRVKNRAYPFEQFDLKFNRPDKVIETLDSANATLIKAYKNAYKKRLKRLNFTEDMLVDNFHLPKIEVLTKDLPISTDNKIVTFTVKAIDTKYHLDRLNVSVNGVPIYGIDGINLRNIRSSIYEKMISINLSKGANKIQVSVMNQQGVESLKEFFEINFTGDSELPDLHLVAIGISDYADDHLALKYSSKDAKDIISFFRNKSKSFRKIILKSILDNYATRENILAIRDLLMQTTVDDMVILFFSGHGLLDSHFDYYFATYDIDFLRPSQRGIVYHEIENLFNGIPARKKLLLMDTCHSGEIDKEEIKNSKQRIIFEETDKGLITARNVVPIIAKKTIGLDNSVQLLKDLFADLRKGTGTNVISAAGGMEFAYEDKIAMTGNGFFTYALLKGLNGGADLNKDNEIRISELATFIKNEVKRMTNGRQRPTIRRENFEYDFKIY